MTKIQAWFRQTEIWLIPEDWEVVVLSKYIKIKHWYAFKWENITENKNDNILLTPWNFKIWWWFQYAKKYYNWDDYSKSYILKKWDLIVSMTDLSKWWDTLWFTAKIPDNPKYNFLHNQRVWLIEYKNDLSDLHNEYLYWRLRNYDYQQSIIWSSTWTTVKHTSPWRIWEFEFALPPLPEQKAIAEILSSLDDKIELLEKQNKTLENIWQALFKSWFVEFEPFLDDLVESEMGMIPRGWRVGKVGDLIEVTSGKRPNNKTSNITETHKIPLYWANWIMWYVEDHLYNENIILIWRVWTHGEVKRLHWKSWPSDNTLVLKSKYYEYAYQILLNINYSELNRWAVQPLITQTDIKNYNLLIPKIEVLESFEKLIWDNFEKIKENNLQIETLSNLRDSLLPRLMSGKIRVV